MVGSFRANLRQKLGVPSLNVRETLQMQKLRPELMGKRHGSTVSTAAVGVGILYEGAA